MKRNVLQQEREQDITALTALLNNENNILNHFCNFEKIHEVDYLI
jgi:hypothetical protein